MWPFGEGGDHLCWPKGSRAQVSVQSVYLLVVSHQRELYFDCGSSVDRIVDKWDVPVFVCSLPASFDLDRFYFQAIALLTSS